MIEFSWKKINDKFDWNAQSVLEYFFLKQKLKVPSYLHRKIPQKVIKAVLKPYPKGPCFLINPNEVLLGASAPNDLYIYLELASMRNIFDYCIRGIRYLPLVLVPEYLKNWVLISPLLEVKDDKVYFKYEQEKQNDN
jgi:hypothetical protein